MVGIVKITRNLADLIGNVFDSLFGNVFAWLWFAALLIVVAILILLAPIKAVGEGGPSLSAVVATIGGMLLVAAGGGWVWRKLGEDFSIRLGGVLGRLIVFGPIIVVTIWLWWSWDVPDIWYRPLAALTLGDIGQNLLKLVVLFCGLSFISALVRALFSLLRKD
jgi:hypothetical protein